MSDDLVKRWDEYVESMGCVMGEVEHMAQQMRDRIEELEAKLAKAVEEAYAEGFAEGSAGDWIEGDYSKPWAKSQAFAELTGGAG